MTFHDAVETLRSDPGHGSAWRIVDGELKRLAAKITDDAGLREGAVEAVRRKFEEQILDGDLDPIAAPAAWFSKALRWRVYDLVRRRKRALDAAERARQVEAERAAEAARNPPLAGELLEVLEEVAKRAVARRDAWQRPHLEHAWGQIKALHLEDRTLKEIVAADEGLDPTDTEAVERAVQRAHKAHQRARAAFLEALEDLAARGKLDRDTAAEARAAIQRLRRRQERAPAGVSGGRTKR